VVGHNDLALTGRGSSNDGDADRLLIIGSPVLNSVAQQLRQEVSEISCRIAANRRDAPSRRRVEPVGIDTGGIANLSNGDSDEIVNTHRASAASRCLIVGENKPGFGPTSKTCRHCIEGEQRLQLRWIGLVTDK
jgi:hypothetical protein